MEQQKIIKEISDETVEYIQEYEQIMHTINTVTIQTEWTKDGDYFQKLSMYDDRYTPVITLGSTTLIKGF
jgi:hypothetical protein